MEISTKENEKLVSTVYESAMKALHGGREITEQENFVFQVELLSQEVNSGASFEQYFRWVGKAEVDEILGHIQRLDAPQLYSIVEEAIRVAFPNGVPDDEDGYERCTDWNEAQEERLQELFEKFEQYNGVIGNKLGQFIVTNELV